MSVFQSAFVYDVHWHFPVLVSLHSKLFFCLPSPLPKTKLLGQAVSSFSLLTPTWPCKNGSWAWTTSLPRDEEPMQPVLMWISFPVASSVDVPLFCLSVYVIWHLANLTAGQQWGRDRVLLLWQKKGVPRQIALLQLWRYGQDLGGTNTHYWRWSCSVFYLWK